MEEQNILTLFDSIIEHIFVSDDDLFKLDSIIDTLLGWVFYVIDHFVVLFFSLLDDHSDDISLIGRYSANTIDDSFHFDFSSDFIFFFIGLLVVIFIFKLVWELVCSLIP